MHAEIGEGAATAPKHSLSRPCSFSRETDQRTTGGKSLQEAFNEDFTDSFCCI